jgi:hypothetical protein
LDDEFSMHQLDLFGCTDLTQLGFLEFFSLLFAARSSLATQLDPHLALITLSIFQNDSLAFRICGWSSRGAGQVRLRTPWNSALALAFNPFDDTQLTRVLFPAASF